MKYMESKVVSYITVTDAYHHLNVKFVPFQKNYESVIHQYKKKLGKVGLKI